MYPSASQEPSGRAATTSRSSFSLLEDLVDGELELLPAEPAQDRLQPLLARAARGDLSVEVALDALRHPAVDHEKLEELLVEPALADDPGRRNPVALLVDLRRGHRLARFHGADVDPVRLACRVTDKLAFEEHRREERDVVEVAPHLVRVVD